MVSPSLQLPGNNDSILHGIRGCFVCSTNSQAANLHGFLMSYCNKSMPTRNSWLLLCCTPYYSVLYDSGENRTLILLLQRHRPTLELKETLQLGQQYGPYDTQLSTSSQQGTDIQRHTSHFITAQEVMRQYGIIRYPFALPRENTVHTKRIPSCTIKAQLQYCQRSGY